MRSLRACTIVFLFVLALISCRSPEGAPEEAAPQAGTPEQGAPEGTEAFTSPLTAAMESAVPTPIPELESVIPTPVPEMGVVVGVVEMEEVGRPMSGVPVYLGEPIGSSSGAPLFAMDPSRAPHAEADAAGRFVIADVEPGDYVLILWNPVNSIMARDIDTGEPLVFSVEPGEVVDVGVVREPRP